MNSAELSYAIGRATDTLTGADNFVTREQWLAAMEELERFSRQYADIVAELCQAAYLAGLTKREISRALNIPASYLRDLRRTDVA